VKFEAGPHFYEIIRGIKPNKFEIYKNGVMINQDAKIRDYQKFLEKTILKMNHAAFTQVVVLGSSSYIPFMKLSTSNRRELVEELLDIKIFSSMNLLLKIEQKRVLESHRELTHGSELLREKVKANKKALDSIRKRNAESKDLNESRLKNNNELIEDLEHGIEKLKRINETLLTQTGSSDIIRDRNRKLGILEGQLKTKLKGVEKSIKFYNSNESCPECEQDIDETFKSKIVNEKVMSKVEIDTAKVKLSEDIKRTSESLRNIESVVKDIRKNEVIISKKTSSLDGLKSYNKDLVEDSVTHQKAELEIRELEESIKKQGQTLLKITDKLDGVIEDKEYISFMKSLLSDDGIKATIIKKYVPLINKTINAYLSEMEFHARFSLDEEFNETIYSRYIDQFQYSNFSEGEKQRIDLALLFTWRKISKMKNCANTNLLIIDEIFDSSLDNAGTEEFMKILYSLENENVFVISHKNHMSGRFDNVIEFKKFGNFSRRI
jgi:DNA repair exonuclease SbcCD ATPase subunit